MKTILRITKDDFSELSYDLFIEDINYLVNELNLFCEIRNNKFNNIVEDNKRYLSSQSEYKDKLIVEARGYSQSDWQEYTLYYNESELKTSQQKNYFESLVTQLERSFTHFNDYSCELFEREEIDGKVFDADPHDWTTFCIDDIEFPDEEDVKQRHNEIYGENHDEIIIEIN